MSQPPPGQPASAESPRPRVGAGFDFADPNSPLAPLYLGTAQVVAVVLIALVFVAATFFPLWHTDVWGHLRYGQWMAEHGRIPDREPFCPWWDGRVPFTQFYTLTQLPMYWVYAAGERLAGGDEVSRMAGGIELLRTLHAGLTAARFAVLLAVFLRLSRRNWPVSIAGLVAVALLDLSNLAVFRPQTFAQLYFAVLLYPLSRECLSRRAVVLIPLLLVLWANSHGSYLAALALLGVLLAGRVAELVAAGRWRPWQDPAAVRLALTLGLCVVAIAGANPYGPSFFARTLELTRHPTLIAAVGEWKPVTFEWEKGWHWVFMISLVVVALTQAAGRPSPPGHLFILLLFGVGVALQTRFVIWWAMLVPWVLVPRWAELALRWPVRWRPTPAAPTLKKTGLAVLLTWALLMWTGLASWLVFGNLQPPQASASAGTPWQLARQLRHPDDPAAVWSPELAEVLRARYPGGRFTGTVMATPMQGDYLMWALAPGTPVTYAHMHLFPHAYWEELGVVSRGHPGWWDVLDKYRVNMIVAEAEYSSGLRAELLKSKGWKIVLDETGDVAAKPEPLTRQLIAVRVTPR